MKFRLGGKAKRLATGVASVLLGAVMCFGVVACSDPTPGPDPDPGTGTGLSVPSYETSAGGNGTTSGDPAREGKFYSDYADLEETHAAGKRLNIELAEEGDVLLKNENGALPLKSYERDVSLFGIKSVDIQTGGGGSGSGNPGAYYEPVVSLQQSMEDAGFHVNQKLINLYNNNLAAMTFSYQAPGAETSQTYYNELPMSYYTPAVTETYGAYNDAAIVTISRLGSEGFDLLLHDVPTTTDKSRHYLELTEAEEALIRHVKQNFDKVIVLVNSSNIMEMGALNAPKTEDNLGVDAILWVGHTGNDGAQAIGEILAGTVNPSGHTVDLWASDFTKDPTWTNFGDMSQNKNADGTAMDNLMYLNGEPVEENYRSVEYREGIFIGYRYYETMAADMDAAEEGSGEEWYGENVVYPFGYGLSYTSFEWELDPSIAPNGLIKAADGTVTMKVKVTNTGDVAGKDVVQVYASAPYTAGGIDKASATLMGFAKTNLLEPDESEVVTIRFAAQDMASFDWNDANNNGFIGYELEPGAYTISARRNSHEEVLSVNRTIESAILCETDLQTGNKIEAVFSQYEGPYAAFNSVNASLEDNLMTRANLAQPAAATIEDRTISQAFIEMIEEDKSFDPYLDSADDPWYISKVPSAWKQATAAEEAARVGGKTAIQLKEMAGIPYSDPTVADGVATAATDEGTKKWDEFMNQLTWEELCQLVSNGRYGRDALASIGKPYELDLDGPAQLAWIGTSMSDADAELYDGGMGTLWVTAVVIASTWNTELAEQSGRIVGNESLHLNCVGWYGPSMNTHRSPFGGRNFEYYSEDGVLAGHMAAAIVRGATSKGVVVWAKHMFLNEQETNRGTAGGVFTYATEQAIREIYLKPFEYTAKSGCSLGFMTSFNRVGNVPCLGNYAVNNAIFRQEWGFQGAFITDSWGDGIQYNSTDWLVRNGTDVPLGNGDDRAGALGLDVGTWNESENMVYVKASAADASNSLASPTQYYSVRTAAQHLLYVSANSNAMDNCLNELPEVIELSFNGLSGVNTPVITEELLGTSEFTDVAEVIAENETSKLPAGLTINSVGQISGTPTRAGVFEFDISFKADGWARKTAHVRITIAADIFDFSGAGSATVGTAYSGAFSCSKEGYRIGDTFEYVAGGWPFTGTYSAATYKVVSGDLPAGLTLAEDGTLSGTPSTAGTYTFEVQYTVSGIVNIFGMMDIPVSVSYTQPYTITVA